MEARVAQAGMCPQGVVPNKHPNKYLSILIILLRMLTVTGENEDISHGLQIGKDQKGDNETKKGMNERTSSLLATDRDQRQAFRRQDRDRRLALHWSVLLLRSVPSNLAYSCGTPFGP